MSLSIVRRPEGYAFDSTSGTATYTNGSSTLTMTSHGLITGDHIYFATGIVVGFWYVTRLSANTFTISEYSGATVKSFIGAGSVTFNYITSPVNYHCASELPINYKLLSTLWPVNRTDTARTVSSFSNDNGYTKLTLSGSLKSDLSELEFVQLTGPQAGIFQIVTFYSTSIVTIDLVYNSGFSFGTVQYYYRNYRALIKISAGIKSTHYLQGVRPYEVVSTISVVPDSNNLISININEIIKKKLDSMANNLNASTLQNNVDAWCNFKISYAEGYDYTAGGYGIMDFVSSYVDDTVDGTAINADLPFKNSKSGNMTDYLYANASNKLKFLHPGTPVLTAGVFFDVSFINQYGNSVSLIKQYYKNGVLQSTAASEGIKDYGPGVYRVQVSSIADEDRIDLTLHYQDYTGDVTISETKSITVIQDCYPFGINMSWLNYLGGFDYTTFRGFYDTGIEITGAKTLTKNIFTNWPNSWGADADTVRQESQRRSNTTITLRAENLTGSQVDDLVRIKSSPSVFIVNSATDRRRVIVDTDSVNYHPTANRLFELSITVTLTDEIPSQTL